MDADPRPPGRRDTPTQGDRSLTLSKDEFIDVSNSANMPGVRSEEEFAGNRAIRAAGTSVAAFVGTAMDGPVDAPVRILGFGDFERRFGGLASNHEMGHAVRQFFLNGGSEAWVVRVALDVNAATAVVEAHGVEGQDAPGDEGQDAPGDEYERFAGDRTAGRGIHALEAVDAFNLLCLPGVSDSGVLAEAAAFCERRRAFLLVDAPRTATTPEAMARLGPGTALPKSSHAAVYFPWVWIPDPLDGGRLRLSAPCGALAGVYARTDASRGVWKAPAGTAATLIGVQKVDYRVMDADQDLLNPLGINAIRILPGIGAVAWGARTLRGDDRLADDYRYVPVRRLALHIEESLHRGTQWALVEPNGEPLWARLRLAVGAFMHSLFRKGAFAGSTSREAYFVKCDRETMSQDDIDHGLVNILVGFAPLKPAEFVILRIRHRGRGGGP